MLIPVSVAKYLGSADTETKQSAKKENRNQQWSIHKYALQLTKYCNEAIQKMQIATTSTVSVQKTHWSFVCWQFYIIQS